MNKHNLDIAWVERCKLRAEAGKLGTEAGNRYADGAKLRAERGKRHADGSKLFAEADKLYAERHKRYTEGSKLWLAAVHRECGPDVLIEWPGDGSCVVAGVMLFLPQDGVSRVI